MSSDSKAAELIEKLKRSGITQVQIANAIGRAQPQAARLLKGERQLKADEVEPLEKLIAQHERNQNAHAVARPVEPDLPPEDPHIEYERVEVLPTYAGAGGGGTGEGDVQYALVPTYLIRHVFRGQPSDFLLINIRGDSMEPDYRQDDQILIDKRDRSPAQPGPMALWDAEWEEYVLKNVEAMGDGRIRIFSTNPKYNPREVQHDQTRILGRPVWFGRRVG